MQFFLYQDLGISSFVRKRKCEIKELPLVSVKITKVTQIFEIPRLVV